jgi:phosphate transport system protein
MSRKILDYELQTICDDLLILSSMVETALCDSVTSVKEYNKEISQMVMMNDAHINKKRYAIEAEIVVVIATQSPVTRDLRFLSSALTVCSELERIGDYAKTVAKVNLRLQEIGVPRLLSTAYNMGSATMDMLHRAMTAFVLADAGTARRIIPEDDNCDGMYQQIYAELMKFIVKDVRNAEYVNNFLWIAHNLERAGDRVTNICERAIYIETGELGSDSSSMDGL